MRNIRSEVFPHYWSRILGDQNWGLQDALTFCGPFDENPFWTQETIRVEVTWDLREST